MGSVLGTKPGTEPLFYASVPHEFLAPNFQRKNAHRNT